MSKATLKQAGKIISVFEDTSNKQVQAILGSGLLADLRDGNIAEVNRDEFRKAVGLKPLQLQSLESESLVVQLSDTGAPQSPYEGWELVEDAVTPFGTLELELAKFLKSGENSVGGTEMRERAKKLGPMLGQRHARALLEKQERIPESWRKFYPIFPGTLWRVGDGRLLVPCLDGDGGKWILDFCWLKGGWGLYNRIVSLRK